MASAPASLSRRSFLRLPSSPRTPPAASVPASATRPVAPEAGVRRGERRSLGRGGHRRPRGAEREGRAARRAARPSPRRPPTPRASSSSSRRPWRRRSQPRVGRERRQGRSRRYPIRSRSRFPRGKPKPRPPRQQNPAARAPAPGCGPWRRRSGRGSRVAIQSVEADAAGGLVAKGSAEPNATVRLYLNQADLAKAKTQSDGRWSLTIKHGMTPGGYVMHADVIGPGGATAVASANTPFDYPAAPSPADGASPASRAPSNRPRPRPPIR